MSTLNDVNLTELRIDIRNKGREAVIKALEGLGLMIDKEKPYTFYFPVKVDGMSDTFWVRLGLTSKTPMDTAKSTKFVPFGQAVDASDWLASKPNV